MPGTISELALVTSGPTRPNTSCVLAVNKFRASNEILALTGRCNRL
jgi:hypothetical protein